MSWARWDDKVWSPSPRLHHINWKCNVSRDNPMLRYVNNCGRLLTSLWQESRKFIDKMSFVLLYVVLREILISRVDFELLSTCCLLAGSQSWVTTSLWIWLISWPNLLDPCHPRWNFTRRWSIAPFQCKHWNGKDVCFVFQSARVNISLAQKPHTLSSLIDTKYVSYTAEAFRVSPL